MLKYILVFILLFLISCNSQKAVQRKESVIVLNNNKDNSVFLIYEDYSKESLIINKLSDKLSSLNYKQIILPVSEIKNYRKYYNKDKKTLIISLGNALYSLNNILKLNYDLLIADSPGRYGNIPENIIPSKTVVISDLDTLKYAYQLISNKNYSLYFKKDKYAWFLSNEKFLSLKNKYTQSKISFKQINNQVKLNNNLNNKLVILFTSEKALFRNCDNTCILLKGIYVKSVYIPINNNYDTPENYNELSVKIKKIFNLIKQKKYLDSYLFMLENKNKFNLSIFKKIFAFISKPLYKIEPDLKKDESL